ncbi:M-phase phosphoprotein 9 isoform X1 [Epinephelus fuscoguttatus]|uniref:M-phase phosphoprotein 9 isoform X1 n=1 Tax=Epinephelus fuscoguttatus TaxID=293821 RepID=UPI0020D133B8|nr:M-phase phosphoprotein 9 isoform X1 [Epinephelus fuscoguttatus]
MSTDDSISEDVSSSGALSHCHVSADGDVGKESETSLVSSEGTSASGLAVSEERHTTSQTTGGTVESRPMDITPACNKIRSLCLSTDEAFEQGKSLPFINPSSLETLRALVQEIQSSGETDPEIWKDCEGRWLHLFQLVEKQYQEQILAQQEQYQCQIQLIQDEIKALVQLQNRQASVQFSPASVTKTPPHTKDYIFPLISSDCTVPKNVASDNDSLAAPAHTPFSSPSPPLQRSETANQGEERATTVLSSGYGTLSAWETGLEPAGSLGDDEEGGQEREKDHWAPNFQEDTEMTVIGCQQDSSHERTLGVHGPNPLIYQQRNSGTSQLLTSWAQMQKLRPKKSKAGQASSQTPEHQEQPRNLREPHKQIPPESSDLQDQERAAGPSSSSFPLRRSDSLMSEASGLTYWRLNESELYHPLPDSFDSGAYLLLQEASMSLEPRLSLKEIYQNKQRTDCKRSDWESSVTSSPSSPQMLTLDPAANQRQSDRTSGFTSPSHFSSPSFAAPQPHLYPRVGTPVTPDSMVECSPNPGDTDCISDTSSVSAAGPSPSKVQSSWGNQAAAAFTSQDKTQPCSHTSSQQRRASAPLASEEEGSHTHTSTLKPCSASGASLRPAVSPNMERASSLEDPVVLSLLRQNLREKHSRHVADLKAYYESEIQILRDKLKLRDLPQDLEKSNQVLTERCKHLEKALAEATSRIQELEATNGLLEKKLAEWPERYAVAGATVKSLQQRLEESKRSGKEKDASAARLKSHIRQLEESVQKACREADESEAKREREYKMLQDLLGEYDSLLKEHEGLKNNVVSTENKLVDANDQILDLKRIISKLESQVKQLEHENQARARYSSHSNTQPSGAGLFHHPDLLLSPSKGKVEPDVTRRKSPCPPSDQLSSGRKSPFPQTNQSSLHKKSQYPSNDKSSGTGSSVDTSSAGGSWRCASPPECEQSLPQHRHQEQSQREAARRDGSCSLTPMMRALIELEETRATESRAPCKNSPTTHRVGNQRTTVGFVERKHKEVIQERAGLQADREAVKHGGVVMARAERGGGGSGGGGGGGGGGVKKAAALLRAQRSLSPEGHRSSSLPPPEHRNRPTTTPTKRGTLIMPMSAKSSPKRCPTENYSTAFGHMMPREEHLHKRIDGQVDQRRHSFHSSSPRKKLHFTSADREDDLQQPESTGSVNPLEGNSQLGWEEQGACSGGELQDSCEDSAPLLLDRLHSLAEAEKLFDELTQEKLQIEAALSRMPGAGGRVTLQTRLDEVALENRLERLNRELGSIRMTLKRFHVLRSSANI